MFKTVAFALLSVLTTALVSTGREPRSEPLTPEEAAYIHAVALKIVGSSNDKQLYEKALKSAKEEKPKWKSSNDAILKSLARLETDEKLRELYRDSLKKRLGDDPMKNGSKLIADISRDFSKERVAKYHEELKKSKGKSVSPDAAPFPICLILPWGPCPDQ